MDLIDFIWHLAGFVAPAVFVAPVVVMLARFLERKRPLAGSWQARVATNLAVCLAVLMIGLALTGEDGRMVTYGAMVLASAVTELFRPVRA